MAKKFNKLYYIVEVKTEIIKYQIIARHDNIDS